MTGVVERPGPDGDRPEPPGPAGAAASSGSGNAEEPGWRTRHLRPLLAVCGLVLVAAAVLGAVLGGAVAAAGAAAGVGIVVASYTVSTLVIAWADRVAPALVLPFGLAAYAAKFTLIGVVMAAVAAARWPGLPALGFGVLAGVVAWTATQIWWTTRTSRAPSG